MAYKPNTWVITSQNPETFVIEDETLTDIAMGENDTTYEIYKTDESGLRCDAKWGIHTAKSEIMAKVILDNLKYADTHDLDPKYLCPHCGNDLTSEIGITGNARATLQNGCGVCDMEFTDQQDYYCTCCGDDIDKDFGEEIEEKFYG